MELSFELLNCWSFI